MSRDWFVAVAFAGALLGLVGGACADSRALRARTEAEELLEACRHLYPGHRCAVGADGLIVEEVHP